MEGEGRLSVGVGEAQRGKRGSHPFVLRGLGEKIWRKERETKRRDGWVY